MLLPILLSTAILCTPVWTQKEIRTQWTYMGEGYEYILEIYTNQEYSDIYMIDTPTTSLFSNHIFTKSGYYFQRVKSYPISSPQNFKYEYLGQFYLDLEHGEISESESYHPPCIPTEREEEVEKEETDIQKEEVIETKESFFLPNDMDMREEVLNADSQVLGSSIVEILKPCTIYIFKKYSNTYTTFNCSTNTKISGSKYLDWDSYLTLDINGIYSKEIYAEVIVSQCKKFTLTDPNTWFECKQEVVDRYTGYVPLKYTGTLYFDSVKQNSNLLSFKETTFSMQNLFRKDISNMEVKIKFDIYGYVKGKEWIDINYSFSKVVNVSHLENVITYIPFNYPFKENIGVNQWYGCTTYQCPHKGIDFGAYLKEVQSIGDGKVISMGYDRYGGECNQGGYYLILRHTNGKYSTYFHLNSFKVKVNDLVKKGDIIGISGNSGKWNCQKLGYHLHFELRNTQVSTSHINPVPYININWNLIPTLGYKSYPGRLSGENPHPNF